MLLTRRGERESGVEGWALVVACLYLIAILGALVPIGAVFLAHANHDGFNSHETLINPTSASQLKQKWAHPANSGVSDQPIESAGIVYWGSWNGYIHATNISNNAKVWATFIGQTTDSSCDPPIVGVASSPTLGTVNAQLAIFVGGGDATFYALSAATG